MIRTLVRMLLFLAPAIGLAQTSGSSPALTPAKASASSASVRSVSSDNAPKAIGAYSQGVVAGGFLYTAGMTPRDPKTGDMVGGGIEPSTERVLDNLEAVLKAEGLSFSDVVKTTVYLTKMDDFQAFNAVYAKRMGDSRPARTTVAVAALPGNAPIEIDMVAKTKK